MTEAEIRAKLPPGLAHAPLAWADHRPAAVLVPLEPDKGVWLTRRASHLPNHAGQVAFPGGKIEFSDPSVEAAALREAYEEIGLQAADADILGRMDDFITGTGFHISPVVALVRPGVTFSANPAEVQDVFCLPFATLLDITLPHARTAYFRGEIRDFWLWPHDSHIIWGATAQILRNLAQRLRRAS
jgi:8-oxo-dGTP pyrophosphatase MutT (NUDIX family)